MTSVGVRELRQRASELLRLVEQGQTIEITDRGRPVALLSPLVAGTPPEQMRPAGEIAPAPAQASGRRVLSRVDLVRVNNRILNLAGSLSPVELRSVDAIHLATASRLGSDLGEIVTYDDRLAAAARSMGYKVSSPT